jgi:hypothetical protein
MQSVAPIPLRRRSSLPPPPDDDRPVVRLSGPGDVVSALPYLVGFTPRRSLVVVCLRGPRMRLGLVERVDLPPDPDDPGARALVVDSVVRYARGDSPRAVVLAVFDDLGWVPDRRPWQSLVDATTDGFADVGIGVNEAVYLDDERFWSYTCRISACCPEAGTLLEDVRGSQIAAAYVALGRAPSADRADLEARLAPAGPLQVRVAASAAAVRRQLWCQAEASAEPDAMVLAVDAAAQRFDRAVLGQLDGARRLGPKDAGDLLADLARRAVRDRVVRLWTRWPEAMGELVVPVTADRDRDLDHEESAASAVRAVLEQVVQHAGGTAAAPPATLLAMHHWSRGDGGEANIALDRALGADPEHRFALLLRQALDSGLAPVWTRALRERDESA